MRSCALPFELPYKKPLLLPRFLLLHLYISQRISGIAIPFHHATIEPLSPSSHSNMTRSHKVNDHDHTGLADDVVPRYFAKTGPINADPNKTKKDGGGKGNWGRSGEEVQDYDYNFTNARRRSNSSNHGLSDFKTKFETVEPEPVFEEEFPGVDEKQGSGIVREVEADTDVNRTTSAS
ncbi:ATPase-stabilizing factor 15 kDa protein, putative [Talaromyces stipitatus ATCC 10500]|uniref:ATPase-stabilizing factor 15 kDa protein, putative n=1 Tax=Talaromyces stipitatus (strain ATCC 10500 / CBS 375.48 / QM 6759 / NRRL 1006) TaxID=441959 RepID=B8M7A6_TALSN|nr:ATPase-stabilizing factor 15 kDa protein, putative [Talaromyces stipitatus ATCC 10500]EED20326.1 ATPase-stabilizing factor 15 kDa protein, putative [Talaromyces stipitatus ATCC 10500]